MHILVTGASGFIGQVLTRKLAAQEHQITTLSSPRRTEESDGVLVHDLGSGSRLSLPDGIEAVIHLAQSRRYREFPADSNEMFRVNVAGTQEVLKAAADAGAKRFCLISSGTVYEPFIGPLTEDSALVPKSYLGASKLAAELIAQPFAAIFDLSVLRLFMPYGPGQTGRLIPTLIERIDEGKPVILPETGDGMRFSPTYVDDICEVISTATSEGWCGTYNVAGAEDLSIVQACDCIGKTLGKKVIYKRTGQPAPNVVPDLTKLGRSYDLARLRSFKEGLSRWRPGAFD